MFHNIAIFYCIFDQINKAWCCLCMFVCVCVYIYIYIYIHTHTCAHTQYTHTHTRVCVCVCVCVCVLYEEYECFSFLSLWDCFSNRGEGSVKASAPSSNKYENISFLLSLCPSSLCVLLAHSPGEHLHFPSLTHPSFSRNISSTVTIASLLPLCYWYNYLLTQLLAVTVTIPAKEKTISLFKRGLGHFSAGQTERSSFQPA